MSYRRRLLLSLVLIALLAISLPGAAADELRTLPTPAGAPPDALGRSTNTAGPTDLAIFNIKSLAPYVNNNLTESRPYLSVANKEDVVLYAGNQFISRN